MYNMKLSEKLKDKQLFVLSRPHFIQILHTYTPHPNRKSHHMLALLICFIPLLQENNASQAVERGPF